MSQINPLAASIVQSPQVQQALSTEKGRQLRRVTNLSKNIAAREDQFEHQVESADAVHAVPKDSQQPQGRRHAPPPPPARPTEGDGADEDHPGIDLKA